MGCDIHTHVEYRKNIYTGTDESGASQFQKKWLCGDYFSINEYYDGSDEDEQEYKVVGIYNDRNYSLFATLADVRNYGDTQYIDEPRGLPDDVTDRVKVDSDDWDIDGHSHSYFTLRELMDFQNAHKAVQYRGMISPEAQKQLDEKGVLPEEWCQGTNIDGWAWRTWSKEFDILNPLIEVLKRRADELYLIPDWLWEREPETALEKANDIRIVFWFDN